MKKIFSTQVQSWEDLNKTIGKIKEAIGTPLLPSGFSDLSSLIQILCTLKQQQDEGYASLVFEYKEDFEVRYMSSSSTYVRILVSFSEDSLAEVEVHLPDARAVPGRFAYESLTKNLTGWESNGLECPLWVSKAQETRAVPVEQIEAVIGNLDQYTRTSENRWVTKSGVVVARRDDYFVVSYWGDQGHVYWGDLPNRLKNVYRSIAVRSRPWEPDLEDYDGADYDGADYDGMDHDGPVD